MRAYFLVRKSRRPCEILTIIAHLRVVRADGHATKAAPKDREKIDLSEPLHSSRAIGVLSHDRIRERPVSSYRLFDRLTFVNVLKSKSSKSAVEKPSERISRSNVGPYRGGGSTRSYSKMFKMYTDKF